VNFTRYRLLLSLPCLTLMMIGYVSNNDMSLQCMSVIQVARGLGVGLVLLVGGYVGH